MLTRRDSLRFGGLTALGISASQLPAAAAALSVDGVRLSGATVFWGDNVFGNSIGRLEYDGISASAKDANWLTGITDVRSLTTDGTSLFYTNVTGDAADVGIWRVDVGAETRTLVVASVSVEGLFVDDTHIYYGVTNTGIFRIAKDGSGSATQLVSGTGNFSAICVAGEVLYFTKYNQGVVASAPKAGGSVTQLATGITSAYSIDVSGGVIYVGIGSDRVVRRFQLDGTPIGTFPTGGYINGLQVVGASVFVSVGNAVGLEVYNLDGSGGETFASFGDPLTNATSGIAVLY